MERTDGVRAREIVRGCREAFTERGAIDVARDLLGKVLVHGLTAGIIVETEAYLGGDDLASRTPAAGITDRTRVIFQVQRATLMCIFPMECTIV